MKILVQKFGGTSVDRHEHRLLSARKVIKAKEAGYAPVVVVSAIGRAGAPYATDTLQQALKDVDPQVAPSAREMDMMMACGEILSAAIFAQTLHTLGHKAIALTGGQAGIFTEAKFGDARIKDIRPEYLHHLLEEDYIPVVCGFQGLSLPTEGATGLALHASAITTLGRGGSDTTGAALGAALKAVAVEIYTDVDGVKTADPNMVPAALTLAVCTYEEVAEFAHQGAKVVHPRAAEIAMEHDIPLWVKTTFSDAPGTRIAGQDAPEAIRQRITGITHTGKIVYVRLEIENSAHKPIIEREVYRMMARAGVNIYLVTFSRTALSFAVPRDLYPIARDLLDGMVIPVENEDASDGKLATFYIFKFSDGQDLAYSVQRPLLKPMEERVQIVDVPGYVTENCTMVSVIASGHRRVTGVIAQIYETLTKNGIGIVQVANSEMSISCLIAEADVKRAVRLLHEQLFEQ